MVRRDILLGASLAAVLSGCGQAATLTTAATSDASGETDATSATTTDDPETTGDDTTGAPEPPYEWPDEDLTQWVDPRIGSGGTGFGVGSINPGPTVPFSLVKVGPDTGLGGLQIGFTNCAGYSYADTHLWGFAHTRFNGMGVPDFGAILVTPTTGMDAAKAVSGGARSAFSHEQEIAEVGYYAVDLLDTGIHAELTGATYGAHHRYTWPQATDEATIIFDLGYNPASEPSPDSAFTIDVEAGEISGYTTVMGGYSDRQGGLVTHFVARFDRPILAHGIYEDGSFKPEGKAAAGGATSAYVQFAVTDEAPTVEVQVGLSYISVAGARENLDASLPTFSFDETRAAAREAWQRELERVRIAGGSDAQRRIFYSSMYRAFLSPTIFSEAEGAYLGFDGEVHDAGARTYYSDFSLWDTYRTLHPLFNLIQRERHADMMQSLVWMYEQGGDLPKWPLGAGYTGGMVGTSADIVLADAALKGIDGFDQEKAYEGARAHAMGPRPNAGRADIDGYIARGYVASDAAGGSVSRTLEFAYDDAALAAFAGHLGRADDEAMFRARAQNYEQLWHPELQFFVGRRADGSFVTDGFTPTEWLDTYTEGDAWHYLWFVPHDVDGLAALFGGPEAMTKKLTDYFEITLSELSSVHGNSLQPFPYYWHSNEPALHDTYLFNDLGHPSETQQWVRWALERHYGDDPGGLPGNDDGGTMSAWYIFSAAGLYPIPGTQRFWIGSPIFERVELSMADADDPARALVIIADGAAADAPYIASATLDGAPLERPWLEWGDFRDGATLHLTMSATPTPWGANP
ncbi:MAG: GH92 family glycosyl hydrolase [Myxococcales bacterium]|nr:GH92 family glycosyl hydrolase [Myxococcales bacterium]